MNFPEISDYGIMRGVTNRYDDIVKILCAEIEAGKYIPPASEKTTMMLDDNGVEITIKPSSDGLFYLPPFVRGAFVTWQAK